MTEIMVKKDDWVLAKPIPVVESGPGRAFRLTKEDAELLGLSTDVKGFVRVHRINGKDGAKLRLEITAEWPAKETVEEE